MIEQQSSSPDRTFAGRNVIVTGGSSGIGRSAAQAFADRGAAVLAIGRDAARLAETAEGRPGIRTLVVDLTDEDAPARVVAAATAQTGRIDALVNNAGIVAQTPLGDVRRAEVERILETNLVAPLLLTRQALPGLVEAGGVVVNVSTAVGQRGWPGMSVYGASKAGLDFLTRTWAVELAGRGVRAVTVAPGPTETPVLVNNGYSEEEIAEVMEQNRRRIPNGRVGTADEVAWWIVALADPHRAAQVSGAWLPVDGAGSVA